MEELVRICGRSVNDGDSNSGDGWMFWPGYTVLTTIRIRLDTESLIKQARNEDEELPIMAAINRFHMIVLLGAPDRRCRC